MYVSYTHRDISYTAFRTAANAIYKNIFHRIHFSTRRTHDQRVICSENWRYRFGFGGLGGSAGDERGANEMIETKSAAARVSCTEQT